MRPRHEPSRFDADSGQGKAAAHTSQRSYPIADNPTRPPGLPGTAERTGCPSSIGPRGDGYVAGAARSPDEAAGYPGAQVRNVAAAGADVATRRDEVLEPCSRTMAGMTTTLTRWGHACIRLDGSGGSLVVDPGAYSDLAHALDGADAVLVTHVHGDHLDTAGVAAAGLPVWGPPEVRTALADAGVPSDLLHTATGGDELEVAGFRVQVLGEWHDLLHADVPRSQNVSYVVDGEVLHPGDAHPAVPAGQVPVLLVPVSGPWVHVDATIDWLRALAPRVAIPIHDAMASDTGLTLVTNLLTRLTDATVTTLGTGEPLALPA